MNEKCPKCNEILIEEQLQGINVFYFPFVADYTLKNRYLTKVLKYDLIVV